MYTYVIIGSADMAKRFGPKLIINNLHEYALNTVVTASIGCVAASLSRMKDSLHITDRSRFGHYFKTARSGFIKRGRAQAVGCQNVDHR